MCSLLISLPLNAQKKSKKSKTKSEIVKTDTFSLNDISLTGLKFRSIGPAVTGGRIIDIDVNPNDHAEYYVASGHGSLWKTTNSGVTFEPIFDGQVSYSIGAVTIDPTNSNVVWVGTGENNAQNNVIYGDGVYKSEDGGKSWKNMGLKESQHIGGIVINPNNPDIVTVAAYGPQRNSGGERGIFRTTDGGETWENVLFISEHTGCWQIHMDPGNPDIIYTAAHQRQRRLNTGVYGGPESGIYRSTDGGMTWERMNSGLPKDAVGRIGLAISPVNPDIVFAVIEAKENGGTYRSTDRGSSWTKQSSYSTSYGFYMHRLYCDPIDVDRVYAMDVFMKISDDAGKTWRNVGEKYKHVDNHSLWIDPQDNRHLLAGCDGGVYETFDTGKNWLFKSNIPITEIYKVTVDNDKPFYNVYIGTQDNNSLGGPSRTISSAGIVNADWYFTRGGDGFETQVDWKNPDIVYSQSQYGGLVRYDKKSGERLYIKPYEIGDTAYRFDWDAALLLSSHDNKRLYFGANKLLRSDDMGSTWTEISGDLSRGFPKELLRLMDRSWSIDELARISGTAQIVTVAESPLDEHILFTGSGDGLIYYTNDGGASWNKGTTIGLPKSARIHHIIASNHDKDVAYAACQHFGAGDYAPYLYKTTDGGKTWKNISAKLPEKGSTYTVGEDHVNPDLLFVGTQFGVFVSNTKEVNWIKLTAGIPPATVMDLDIHREENDLVVSTFGRGVYILDDYSPLRSIDSVLCKEEAVIFPVADAHMYVESNPYGYAGKGSQGTAFYAAPNPKVGAVFTYYIKEKPKSLKEQRRETEKDIQEEGGNIKFPSYETLKKENESIDPYLVFTITNKKGDVIRKIKQNVDEGVHRLVWDFRTSTPSPVKISEVGQSAPWDSEEQGYMVVPGDYMVSLSKFDGESWIDLAAPLEFTCKPLHAGTEQSEELETFNKKVADLARIVSGANAHRRHLSDKIPYLRKAALESADVERNVYSNILVLDKALDKLNKQINGDALRAKYEGSAPTSMTERIDLITYSLWTTTSAPTSTFLRAYEEVASEIGNVLTELKSLENDIKSIELELEEAGAPYTPGRLPVWEKE
jgi:photosystem II stability/assembly factor-like uncharacterized protein